MHVELTQFLETRFAESELESLRHKPKLHRIAEQHRLDPSDPLRVLAAELQVWCVGSDLKSAWRKLSRHYGI